MKILIYLNSMAPAGGVERVISKHIKALAEEHEVVLLTNDFHSPFYQIPDSVNHESLKVDLIFDMSSRMKRIFKIITTFFKIVIRLKKKIVIHKPDVIYVASPFSLLAVFSAQLNIRNVLVTEHASFSSYNRIYKLIAEVLYKKVALLTVPTKDDSSFYTSHGIANVYLPNPLSFFPKTSSTLNNKIVLNVGRFTDDKRHELLIRLWSQTKGQFYGWKLNIVGQGENIDKMKKLIVDLNVEESVCILPVTTEIEQEFNIASIFALTSRAEGFGLVLAEAMASGVPCVAFNCPSGPKDIITNNYTGFLIKEGDYHAFINHLDELMINDKLRKTLGNQARIDIAKFDENIIGKKLCILIEQYFNTVQLFKNNVSIE